MIAVARAATSVDVCGAGLEAAYAVTVSHVRRGVEGVKASTTKTTSGMKAAATMKTAGGMKATAPMETAAPAAMEAAAPTTMEAAAPASATARLGYICERQRHDCAREDPSERQRNPFAVRSSQHIFLHLN
jgi:hypothetical protein